MCTERRAARPASLVFYDRGMPRTITADDLAELERSRPAQGQSRENNLSARVQTLLEWAYDAETEFDGVSRADLLGAAAAGCLALDDAPRALELARAAKSEGGSDALAAIPDIVTALLLLERTEEARAEVGEARALVRSDPEAFRWIVLERIGEELAYFGLLEDAERWFTLCVRQSERGDVDDLAADRALTFRWAVRRRAGKPVDGLDGEAESAAAARGWTNPDPLVFREDEDE